VKQRIALLCSLGQISTRASRRRTRAVGGQPEDRRQGLLVEAAAIHAITAHKDENTPQLREQIKAAMKDEVPGVLAG